MADFTFQQTGAEIQAILNRHLYQHTIQVSIMLPSGAAGSVQFTIINTNSNTFSNASLLNYLNSQPGEDFYGVHGEISYNNKMYFARILRTKTNDSYIYVEASDSNQIYEEFTLSSNSSDWHERIDQIF